jgi:hypothetical protein
MPSKKQRRRRAKSIRHEYEYVYVDEDGNEVEVEPDDAATQSKAASKRAEPEPKPATATKTKTTEAKRPGRLGTRAMREVQPPSWRKVGKRALIFAPVMFFAVSLIDRGRQGYIFYLGQTVFLLAFFLPFSYVMDSITYRMYLKRSGRAPARDEKTKKPQTPSRSPR